MKNFLAKLKGLMNKQAAIDHGEKLFLGVVGLFVLICLAGTSWSRYDKQPKEFQDKVEAGERNIQASAFTKEKQDEYKPREILQDVQTLQSSLEPGRYDYQTNWFWPMYPTAIKITEPKWLAPIQPIADFGKAVIVELPPDQAQPPASAVEIETASTGKKAASDDDDEFAVKGKTTDPTGRSSGPASAPAAGGLNDGLPVNGRSSSGSAYQNMLSGGSGMEGASSGTSTSRVNARGNRFVSVRAVFPLGDQLDELVKAMHEQKQKVAGSVNFLDFEVERQVALPGNLPWSGAWEKVDLQATLDLLDRIEFDTDLVDPAFTDNVFTMPLPRRVIGRWKGKVTDWASHPLIKTLTDEQAEIQAQLNARLVEEAAARKSDDKFGKKGFATKVHDARGLRSQAMGSGQMNSMMTDMSKLYSSGEATSFNPSFSGAGMQDLAGGMAGFSDQVTRNGDGRMSKYLLFRYFDFQVTPGNAYRYRVRLTLLNPNFKRPVEELVDESIAAGEVRVTPWSEPTQHVFVPEEQRMFLTKADKPRPDTGLPSANIDVYQWFSEAGTTIAAKVDKLQLGQFIGGLCKETEVYRPASETLNKEEVPVFTGSLLTDVAPAPVTAGFDLAEHADLKLDDKKLKQWATADKALVVDRYGQLAILDTKSSTDERALAESVVEKERSGIRARMSARPAAGPTAGDLSSGPSSGAGMYPGGMEGMMPGAGGGNSLKKGAKLPTAKKATGKGKSKQSSGSSGGSGSN